jgi:hypothetical protein
MEVGGLVMRVLRCFKYLDRRGSHDWQLEAIKSMNMSSISQLSRTSGYTLSRKPSSLIAMQMDDGIEA